MKITSLKKKFLYILFTVPILLSAMPAWAVNTEELKARIDALEKQVAELRTLLQQQTRQTATKEDVKAVKQDVATIRSQQDEWKTHDSAVHLAGYGAASYDSNAGHFTQAQFSPIFHYSYKDLVMMEAEVEMAIGPDDAPSVDLEYAAIDLFLTDNLTLTAGKFLTPLGQFIPNQHPSWINKMPSMPAGFGHDQAAPVSDTGVMARGGFKAPIGNDMYVNYAAYVGNGPHIELNEAGDDIDAIAAEGFTNDPDGNKIFGGRVGFLPLPNVEVGFSAAGGNVAIVGENDRSYRIYGADFNSRWNNFRLRGEWITQRIGSLASSVVPGKHILEGWYAQGSYRFMPTNFEAILRVSSFDTPHKDLAYDQLALGLDYWFNSHTVAKFAYEFNDGIKGEPANDDRFLMQLAYGF